MRLALPLIILFLVACGDAPSARSSIPDRTVVLTFDDAVRNHLEWVVPRLEERGFGATFFVSAHWLRDTTNYLTWMEIGEIHRRGFEIGNHTWSHRGFHEPLWASRLPRDEELLVKALSRVGVPKPTTFAWPGCAFGPESRTWLLANGYDFARRGMRPERDPTRSEPAPDIAYDPTRHDPLLLPSFEARSHWTIERFRRILGFARDGRAVVLQFHGIPNRSYEPCSVTPETFEAILEILTEGKYNVVALRDLTRWVDPAPVPDDPLTRRHVPDLGD